VGVGHREGDGDDQHADHERQHPPVRRAGVGVLARAHGQQQGDDADDDQRRAVPVAPFDAGVVDLRPDRHDEQDLRRLQQLDERERPERQRRAVQHEADDRQREPGHPQRSRGDADRRQDAAGRLVLRPSAAELLHRQPERVQGRRDDRQHGGEHAPEPTTSLA
jgi:hypothetical protein